MAILEAAIPQRETEVDTMMSMARYLGLPGEVQSTLLLLSLALAISPYLAGVTVAGVHIPDLGARKRRVMKVVGPLLLLGALALVVPAWSFGPTAPRVTVLAADFAPDGVIDLAVVNTGTQPVLLTGLELEVVGERGLRARPALSPTARYRIALDGLELGQRRRIVIRHQLAAGAVERILIAPETTRALVVRVHVYIGRRVVSSTDIGLWIPTSKRLGRRPPP